MIWTGVMVYAWLYKLYMMDALVQRGHWQKLFAGAKTRPNEDNNFCLFIFLLSPINLFDRTKEKQ